MLFLVVVGIRDFTKAIIPMELPEDMTGKKITTKAVNGFPTEAES